MWKACVRAENELVEGCSCSCYSGITCTLKIKLIVWLFEWHQPWLTFHFVALVVCRLYAWQQRDYFFQLVRRFTFQLGGNVGSTSLRLCSESSESESVKTTKAYFNAFWHTFYRIQLISNVALFASVSQTNIGRSVYSSRKKAEAMFVVWYMKLDCQIIETGQISPIHSLCCWNLNCSIVSTIQRRFFFIKH